MDYLPQFLLLNTFCFAFNNDNDKKSQDILRRKTSRQILKRQSSYQKLTQL